MANSDTDPGDVCLDAGNGLWGETMQDDLTWGVKHLGRYRHGGPEDSSM